MTAADFLSLANLFEPLTSFLENGGCFDFLLESSTWPTCNGKSYIGNVPFA